MAYVFHVAVAIHVEDLQDDRRSGTIKRFPRTRRHYGKPSSNAGGSDSVTYFEPRRRQPVVYLAQRTAHRDDDDDKNVAPVDGKCHWRMSEAKLKTVVRRATVNRFVSNGHWYSTAIGTLCGTGDRRLTTTGGEVETSVTKPKFDFKTRGYQRCVYTLTHTSEPYQFFHYLYIHRRVHTHENTYNNNLYVCASVCVCVAHAYRLRSFKNNNVPLISTVRHVLLFTIITLLQ